MKTEEKEGFNSVQVGAVNKPLRKVNKPMLGHFKRAGVAPKRFLKEFRVTKDCLVSVGTTLSARHFVPGQYVDIIATSIGKGFQGAMKRHGFKGQPASHGVSVTHRSLGSVGASGTKMWPGRRMAGRMGGKRQRKRNNWVFIVDRKTNCIFIAGTVPGPKGKVVCVEDALGKQQHFFKLNTTPPFPTFYPPKDENLEAVDGWQALKEGMAKSKRPDEWMGFGDKSEQLKHTDEEVRRYIDNFVRSTSRSTPPSLEKLQEMEAKKVAAAAKAAKEAEAAKKKAASSTK